MSEQEKIYLGSGKEKIFQDGGKILSFSFGPKDLEIMNKWAAENKGWVNINITRRKEVSQYGQTHYAKLNTWKPESEGNSFRNQDQKIASQFSGSAL